MRKLTSLVLLSALVAGFAVPVTCAGWEARAADRMACCQRAHHDDCDDQAAADSCCARQEAAQHLAPSLPIPPPTLPDVPGLAAPAFDRAVTELATRARFTGALLPVHDPPNLSPPPLRI